MNILSWILFGAIVGIIANTVEPNPNRGGLIGAVILGILGAILGGFLGNMIFGVNVTGFNFPSFAIAAIGALLILLLGRAARRV